MNKDISFPPGFLWGFAAPSLASLAGGGESDLSLELLRTLPAGGLVRFTLDWRLLETEEGRLNADLLGIAEAYLRRIKEGGRSVLLILSGGGLPRWAEAQGGWGNARILDRFDLYAAWIATSLARKADYLCTFDAPLDAALGAGPRKALGPASYRTACGVIANLLAAHGRSYRVLKRENPECPVGAPLVIEDMQPLRPPWPPDRWVSAGMDLLCQGTVLEALGRGRFSSPFGTYRVPEAKGTLDFVGLAYRGGSFWTFDLLSPGSSFMGRARVPDFPTSDDGQGLAPEGFSRALVRARSLGKRILILEDTIEDSSDEKRPGRLVSHLVHLGILARDEPPFFGYVQGPLLDGLRVRPVAGAPPRARLSGEIFADIWRDNLVPAALIRQFGAGLPGKREP